MRWESSVSSGQSNSVARVGSTGSTVVQAPIEVIVGGNTIITGAGSEGAWVCDASVAVGDLVEIVSSGTVGKANPSSVSPNTIIGFVAAKEGGTNCTVRYSGEITLTATLSPGTYYYAIDGASISASSPTSGISQPVGIAKTDSVLIIKLTRPIIL